MQRLIPRKLKNFYCRKKSKQDTAPAVYTHEVLT